MTTIRLDADSGHALAHRSNPDGRRGRCLVVPPFGVPAATLTVLTDLLDDAGFETARLDPRDHVGDGTGTIERFRMSTFAADCAAAIDAIEPTCVVALSLGARATMRALARTRHQPHAVFGIPVVDVQATVSTILARDWFVAPPSEVPEWVEILGCWVRARDFADDCWEHGFIGSRGTRRDIEAAGASMRLLPGFHDPWVRHADVTSVGDRAAATRHSVSVRSIDCDRHDIHHDVDQALRLVGEVFDEVVHHHERLVPSETSPTERAGAMPSTESAR